MAGLTTKVTCPKCKQTFDYDFIPGASIYSIRLGNYRYMKCKKCHKGAFFNITQHLPPEDKKALGLYRMLLGFVALVFGVMFSLRGLTIHETGILTSGVVIVALGLFIIISGIVEVVKAGKKVKKIGKK